MGRGVVSEGHGTRQLHRRRDLDLRRGGLLQRQITLRHLAQLRILGRRAASRRANGGRGEGKE
jgi:hypothetical protein